MQIRGKSDAVLFNTVRIVCKTKNHSEGYGTGFYLLDDRVDKQIPFLVSNKHVVQIPDLASAELRFNLADNNDLNQPLLGRTHGLIFEDVTWNSRWFGHPDPNVDVAVMPLDGVAAQIYAATGHRPHAALTRASDVPSAEQEKTFSSQEPVTFVGYPNNVWDEVHNLPIARRGHTATPIFVDFNGQSKFLIDASVFGGSSGSPVLIMDGSHVGPDGILVEERRFYFVGVVSSVYYRRDQYSVYPAPVPTVLGLATTTDQMVDIGVVQKARTVIETIDAGRKARAF